MKVVANRFEVVRHARSGGMGEVFLCNDRERSSRVAVKVLSTTEPKIVERFLREAEILSELDHPAIVRHVAHGVHEEVPFLAMKWIEGETLTERLGRGPLALAEAIAIAERVAEALALVHARGIVHRDVKPSNIVLEGGAVSRAVLLDFGIAHVLEAGRELTRTGDLLGTPGYMAPEQASGASVDARADVFALGCVIFRSLAGKAPFGGTDPLAIAIKLLLEDAPRLTTVAKGIPRELDDLVARMLARTKDDRPADGGVVRAALARLFDTESPTENAGATPSTPTLGADERRVMSLVLARAPSFEPSVASVEALKDVLAAPVAANGAVLDVLADGSIIVTARGGAPHDVAMRAARCALVLREEIPGMKAVVTSGHGVLEADTPVGELVDRAVKLLDDDTDDPTTIRIDAMSAGLLAGRFEVDGDSRVQSLRGERGADRARTLLGKPTPFVGRAREVATLDAMLEECMVESVARAVLVSANPGIGKSRLREEFLRRARTRDDARAWIAFCDPVSKGSPLGLLAQLLRHAFGFQRSDTLAQRQKRILTSVERAFAGQPTTSDPQRIAEFLGEIVGAPFADAGSVELRSARRDPQLLASRMKSAFEELVRAECTKGPLVLVLEDLHWGDAASVKLLDALLGAVATSPLLVLAFARPEIARVHPDLFVERGLQEIRLLELSKRAATELVQKVLGPVLKEDVVDLVVSRAQGNAFFLEELIRAVAEGRSDLPDTVVAMVEARLDELDPVARKVLRAASVFGEEASFGGVHALTGGDAHEIADVLGQLADSEYLSKVDLGKASRSERGTDGTRYQFRHALVREAAYAMLTDDDRRLGHRLAAEWLEARGAQDPLVLADHYERGGDPERARHHFHHAAEQALARSDLDATLAFAHRAVDLGATGETLGALRLLQAEANIWRGDPQALGQAVETLSLVSSGSKEWYRAAAGVLFVAGQIADFGQIVRTIHQLAQQEPRRDDVDIASMQAWAYSLATWLLALLGMYEMANTFLVRASALEPKVDEFAVGWIRTASFFVAKYIERDPWKAYVSVREASAIFRHVGDARTVTLSLVLEGVSLVELGAFEQASDVLRDAIAACERSKVVAARADAKRILGHSLEGLGRFKEAAALEEEAESDPGATHIYRHAARASRGWLLAQLGDLDAGAEHVRSAADDLSFAPSHHAHALAWLARIEVRRGRPEAALSAAESAEKVMRATGAIGGGESAVHVALVESLERSGALDSARAKLTEARAALRERAEKIADPVYRASFLDRIPENIWLRTHAC